MGDVFAVDGEARTWDDVIAAAKGWGEWRDAPARDAVAWRRSRGLLSVDDTVAYLAAWGVALDDWRAHMSGERPDEWIGGIVSGTLERVAARLADALAVHRALGGTGAPTTQELDAALDAFAERVAPPDRIAAVIAEHRLDWTAVELGEVVVETEGAAREVIYGVRDDGLPIDEVAALAGTTVTRSTATVEELPPMLVGAAAGEVVGPLPGWRVVAVTARTEPSPGDPASAARARGLLVARAVRREASARIRWLDPVATPRA